MKHLDFSGITDGEGKPIQLKEEDFIRTEISTYHIKQYPNLEIIQSKPDEFNGDVFVLIDGWVGSQAYSFASLVHHSKRGVFVGEETGGNYNGNTGLIWGNVTLQNTKIQLKMFVFKVVRFTEKATASRKIISDYNVQPSLQDMFIGNDRELITVLNLIKS